MFHFSLNSVFYFVFEAIYASWPFNFKWEFCSITMDRYMTYYANSIFWKFLPPKALNNEPPEICKKYLPTHLIFTPHFMIFNTKYTNTRVKQYPWST